MDEFESVCDHYKKPSSAFPGFVFQFSTEGNRRNGPAGNNLHSAFLSA
ncbi:MAG: hypothetical protein PHW56_06920 [Methanosarcinaceae archaeon]|nr:hypothetical protein [Methanosarcinaceae archaeon]